MRESKFLEFKESVSNTFLKTVSAYANYGTGKIIFGIADDGTVKGIEDPIKTSLDIENRINDGIDPVPEYTIDIDYKKLVLTLTVSEGLHKPYLYKAKAYRRNDSATIPADRIELTRLILEGQNSSFEELSASNQQLSFTILEKKLVEALHIKSVSQDTLKTLELYSDAGGYNKAGELLADANGFPGVDIVRFGENINIIRDREIYEHISILKQYDEAIGMYRKYYQYEQVEGSFREKKSLIPEEAFREAVANALVHRTWDVDAQINIAMFDGSIEITSPGGLPAGVNEEEYLRGGISVLRNRILGGVFYRLLLIERFGTGIRRINEAYKHSDVKPTFGITENTIKVMLPVISGRYNLSSDENKVYSLVKGKNLSSSEIVSAVNFGKSKTISILQKLVKGGYIKVFGNGRGTKYTAS